MTKFVMLALVAFILAACETATTDDVALRSDVGPTASQHKPVVRGPVVPDRVEPAAHRPATAVRVARVVPNPLSQTATTGSAAAAAPAGAPQAAPAEPDQAASAAAEQQPSDTAAALPAPLDALPIQDSARSAQTQPSAPIEFLPKDLTPDKIEALFGGMPFLLLAAIAAALVASFGLALRQPNTGRTEYTDRADRADHLDHREPYAA